MECNNGSILSKIEMTNYSKLRVELWSISYCGQSDGLIPSAACTNITTS